MAHLFLGLVGVGQGDGVIAAEVAPVALLGEAAAVEGSRLPKGSVRQMVLKFERNSRRHKSARSPAPSGSRECHPSPSRRRPDAWYVGLVWIVIVWFELVL